ncbi:MAG: aspartate 1-decarboxylase [Chloroflexi bacterium]|nr:aspartate 1-decarboxylase [Chloroflexota bacterium]
MRTVLKSKIHRARVTGANVDYEGSITIDPNFMEAVDIWPYEQVHVLDIDNGARLETYAIEGRRGSGEIVMNGAAARLIHRGDLVIILSYATVSDEEARNLHPKIIRVNATNAPAGVV